MVLRDEDYRLQAFLKSLIALSGKHLRGLAALQVNKGTFKSVCGL